MKCKKDCYYQVGNECKYLDWAYAGIPSFEPTTCENPVLEEIKLLKRGENK